MSVVSEAQETFIEFGGENVDDLHVRRLTRKEYFEWLRNFKFPLYPPLRQFRPVVRHSREPLEYGNPISLPKGTMKWINIGKKQSTWSKIKQWFKKQINFILSLFDREGCWTFRLY